MTDYSIRRFNRWTDEELFSAVQRVAVESGSSFVKGREFERITGISYETIKSRYGSWGAFCQLAGVKPFFTRSDDREELLTNLDLVWQTLGRQPRAVEMKRPLSEFSMNRYRHEFGNWCRACLEFLSWKSGIGTEEIESEAAPKTLDNHSSRSKEPRAVSLGLRYDVLKRDDFKCVKCGRSPATEPRVQLHIDHTVPYSYDGPTKIDNLQTLCSDCNLGKGNRHVG